MLKRSETLLDLTAEQLNLAHKDAIHKQQVSSLRCMILELDANSS
jgi:hypothetical protein